MATKHMGPAWPIARHLKPGYRGEGPDGLGQLYWAVRRMREDLYPEFDKAAAAIKGDGDLTPAGKGKKLKALADEFRSHSQVAHLEKLLKDQRAREQELRAKLVARPKPKEQSPAELVEAAFRRHRVIDRFERLEPTQRHAAVAAARDKLERGDAVAAEFLSSLLAEPGLLDAQTAQRVESELARRGDPEAFAALEEVVGKVRFDGTHDPITGVLPVSEVSLDFFRKHLDESIGVTPEAREIADALDKADRGDSITLDVDQAHDHRLFMAASARASAKGVELRIVGPEGESSMTPTPDAANGSGGQGGA